MTTLIQQRMALDRQRGRARIPLALAVICVLVGALMLGVSASSWVPWGYFLVGIVSALLGRRRLRAARRAVAAFEAEHGAGAGVQDPLR